MHYCYISMLHINNGWPRWCIHLYRFQDFLAHMNNQWPSRSQICYSLMQVSWLPCTCFKFAIEWFYKIPSLVSWMGFVSLPPLKFIYSPARFINSPITRIIKGYFISEVFFEWNSSWRGLTSTLVNGRTVPKDWCDAVDCFEVVLVESREA